MKAPFYKVILVGKNGDRDISHLVENLSHDDTVEKDSMFEFNVKSDYAQDMADDEDLVGGRTVKFQYGFAGGLQSEVHEGRISDVEPTYAERVKLKVIAFDKGVSMKRIPSQKVWAKMTSSAIAKEIATRYGLATEIDETEHEWANYPQGNKSDFVFLKELAKKEDGFQFYVTSNVLHFKKRDFSKSSVREFRYGDSELIEFAPRMRETQQSGTSNKAQGIAVNPKKKSVVKTSIKSTDDKKDSYLGDYNVNYTVNGDYKSRTEKRKAHNTKKVQNNNPKKTDNSMSAKFKEGIKNGIGSLTDMVSGIFPMPGGDVGNLQKNLKDTNSQKVKTATVKVLEATLRTEGNPTIKLNEIVTMSNVGKRYLGNWRVKAIKNSISAGGAFITTMTLDRNASNKPIKNGDDDGSVKNKGKKSDTKVSGKVNKSKGDSNSSGTKAVKMVRYDVNGNRK